MYLNKTPRNLYEAEPIIGFLKNQLAEAKKDAATYDFILYIRTRIEEFEDTLPEQFPRDDGCAESKNFASLFQ